MIPHGALAIPNNDHPWLKADHEPGVIVVFCLYLNIICAACRAKSTSQNGKTVPIANVPTSAVPSAIHDITPMLTGCSFSAAFSTATVVFAGPATFVVVVGFTATAVALPGGTSESAFPGFVETRLLLAGTGAT